MREYEMETTFDVPLQTFLRVVYGDDGQCLRQYHASCGNCEDATVPAWDVSEDRSSALHGVVGSRTIAFSKPMALPSVVERLLGMTRAGKQKAKGGGEGEGLSFVEKQTIEVDAVTGNVRVRSAASLDSAWVGPERADRFDATVEITYASIRADERGVSMYGASPERTAMAARIIVNAAGAWALQPVVERVMEHRAVAGFREWVVWTDEFVEKTSLGASGFAATLPSLSALGLGSLPVTDAETDLGFERSERLSERRGSARKKAPSEETDAMNGRGSRVPDRTASSHQSGRIAKKKYPATPGASRRASLSVEEGGPSSDVPEPPNIGSGTSDDVSDVTDVTDVSDDADLFDDAASTRSGASSFKSFKSAASFASARSSASATTSSRSARAPDDPDVVADGSTTVGPSEHDAVDGVDELPPPERSRNSPLPGERDASDRRGTAEEPPATPTSRSRRGGVSAGSGSPARLDDAYRDGWFMQTVMNDLTALKTGAGEQSRVVAALEARVRALAAEHARLKAELRRGAGFRLEHRGDAAYASGGRGASLARWTAALSLAAAAGYVLAAAARERR